MTTGQEIDALLTHYLAAGAPDANRAALRDVCHEDAQATCEEVWDECDADFEWKYATTTAALSSGARVVSCPADFARFGESGGLYISGDRWRLRQVNANRIFECWELDGGSTSSGKPEMYAVVTQDGTTFYPQLYFNVNSDAAYTLRLYYVTSPPLLLDRPTALTATQGSAGNLTGAYLYKVTYVATDGSESEAGTASSSVTVTAKQMSLTAIPTGNSHVASRKIYRTVGGGSVYKLVGTISDNTTTTYTDNVADASLGATAPTTSSLQRIPEEYHRSVLLPGARAKLSRRLGDAQAAAYETEYRQNLARMKARRRHGLEDPERLGEEGLHLWGMH